MKASFVRRRDLALEVSALAGCGVPQARRRHHLFPVEEKYYTPDKPDSAPLHTPAGRGGRGLVPGSAFGDDRCVRFSYAVADEVLVGALARVGKVLLGK